MTDMYVANATTQSQDFLYQIPGMARAFQQTIRPGTQIKLSGVRTPDDAQAVVDHHTAYGLCKHDDVDIGKKRAPLIYAIDKPVAMVRIGYANERNLQALTDDAAERMKQGAAAISGQLQQRAQDLDPRSGIGEVELQLIEEPAKPGDETQVNTTVLVESDKPSRSRKSRR